MLTLSSHNTTSTNANDGSGSQCRATGRGALPGRRGGPVGGEPPTRISALHSPRPLTFRMQPLRVEPGIWNRRLRVSGLVATDREESGRSETGARGGGHLRGSRTLQREGPESGMVVIYVTRTWGGWRRRTERAPRRTLASILAAQPRTEPSLSAPRLRPPSAPASTHAHLPPRPPSTPSMLQHHHRPSHWYLCPHPHQDNIILVSQG